MNDIDIVIPWVDGSDENWIAEKNQYDGCVGDKRAVRYRDWDVLKYWFRGIEKFAPWVRKVHFITWGHLPSWIDKENPRLHIVNHKDYIPEEYLPTFSSHTIELNMHRIEDLSEKFVYFNDDFFLINMTTEQDFFVDDLPCDIAALYPGYGTAEDNVFDHILLNNTEFFVKHFNYREILKRDKKKWFKLSYGENLIKTFTMLPYPEFSGIVVHHQPQSFLKSTLKEVWDVENDWLDATCKNRFRSKNDLSQYAFRYWQIGKSKYYPKNLFKRGELISIGGQPLDYERVLLKSKSKIVVLNDTTMEIDFDYEKARMKKAFEKKFPEKSSFER